MAACDCGGKCIKLIYACSGCSDVGEISDRIARKLSAEGVAKMTCLAGIGAGLSGFIESARGAGSVITIDGCPVACGKKALTAIDTKPVSFILTEMSLVKGKTEVNESIINNITKKIKEKLISC